MGDILEISAEMPRNIPIVRFGVARQISIRIGTDWSAARDDTVLELTLHADVRSLPRARLGYKTYDRAKLVRDTALSVP